MRWDELKAGDKIWCLIPYIDHDDRILKYSCQECAIISVHKKTNYFFDSPYFSIRFKYNGYDGKRKRMDLRIRPDNYNKNYVFDLKLLDPNNQYSKIHVVKDGKEELNKVKKMILKFMQEDVEEEMHKLIIQKNWIENELDNI